MTDLQFVALFVAVVVVAQRVIAALLRPLEAMALAWMAACVAVEQAEKHKHAAEQAYEQAGREALARSHE